MSFAALVDELAESRHVRRSKPGGNRTYAVIATYYYVDVTERGLYAGVGAFRAGAVPDAVLAALEGLDVQRGRGGVFAGRRVDLAPEDAADFCRESWALGAPLVDWLSRQ